MTFRFLVGEQERPPSPHPDHVRKLPALIRLWRTFGINENEKDLLLGHDPTPTRLLTPPGPRWKRRLQLSSLADILNRSAEQTGLDLGSRRGVVAAGDARKDAARF